jgi:hypothetical protein
VCLFVSARLRLLVAAAALTFAAAHAPNLPRTLEDYDSVNFALGVESFNVFRHQPHPPGYPVYIALGKISTGVVERLAPTWDRDRRAATGLAILSLIAGALGVWAVTKFWLAVGLSPWLAFLSALVAVASPLYWFTALRPLGDMTGLAAAVAVQAGFLLGFSRRARRSDGAPRVWWWAAAGAGMAIGLRSQTMWLTGPLLLWAVADLSLGRRVRQAATLVLVAAIGALVWAVPLAWLSGGLGPYLSALGGQADQDFAGVEMLATQPSWALLREGLSATFGSAWGTSGLARTVLALALLGAVRLAWRDRRMLAVLLIAFVPYLVFHLTFQETAEVRYGLPFVVPVAGLAVLGLAAFGRTIAIGAAAVLIVFGLSYAQPALDAFDDGHPVFNALRGMQVEYAALESKPMVTMHHQVWWGAGRAFDWYLSAWDVNEGPFPGDRETLAATRHWLTGETRPIWFLAHPARFDLARFDWRTTRRVGEFLVSPGVRRLVGDARYDELNWWVIDRPDWMLGTGWALTPELGGMTVADRTEPRLRPAEAFLRRTDQPLRVLVGGRSRSPSGTATASIAAEIDGRTIHEWTVEPASWFVEWLDLPQGTGTGAGPYSTLQLRVTSADPGSSVPEISFEQFDAASDDEFAYALAEGWYGLEVGGESGRTWRWMSGLATIQIRHGGTDLRLVLSGESPLRDLDQAPRVLVWAGGRELARFAPSDDFLEVIDVPVSALEASGGLLSISTDLTLTPEGPDRHELALRLYRVEMEIDARDR